MSPLYKMLKAKLDRSGSSLIEVLIATVVTGLVLTALAISLSYSVKNSSQADYRQMATQYAQEVIEVAKHDRAQEGWQGFINLLDDGATRCIPNRGGTDTHELEDSLRDALTNTCDIIVAEPNVTFTESFVATIGGGGGTPQTVDFVVTVSWRDGEQTRDVQLTHRFFQR